MLARKLVSKVNINRKPSKRVRFPFDSDARVQRRVLANYLSSDWTGLGKRVLGIELEFACFT